MQAVLLLALLGLATACGSVTPADSPTPETPARYAGYTALRVAVEAGVAYVTLDNPPVNVLDAALMTELNRFAATVRDDPQVRVIVFQSADPEFFLAHGDMNFVNHPDSFTQLKLGDDDGAPLNPMQKLFERFRTLPQVTIAKLAGLARGGGSEFVMALDMRFAAIGQAGLGQFEVLTGIIPGAGGTAYLPRLVGRARALEIVLGAELYDAEQAERYGWVNRALPARELDRYVDTLARRIAALPPGVARQVCHRRSRRPPGRGPAHRKRAVGPGVQRAGGRAAHPRRLAGGRTDARRRTPLRVLAEPPAGRAAVKWA